MTTKPIAVWCALTVAMTGCNEDCQGPRYAAHARVSTKVLIGYKIVGKFTDEDGCWIKYKHRFQDGQNKTISKDSSILRICCCEYDKIALTNVTNLPKEY